MRNILTLLIFIILCLSCNSGKSEFVVTNKQNEEIDSIKISASDKNYIYNDKTYNLIIDNTSYLSIDMTKTDKVDGNYKIEVYKSNTVREKVFGYYSNGITSEVIYKIRIFNDSIIIDEEYEIK